MFDQVCGVTLLFSILDQRWRVIQLASRFALEILTQYIMSEENGRKLVFSNRPKLSERRHQL